MRHFLTWACLFPVVPHQTAAGTGGACPKARTLCQALMCQEGEALLPRLAAASVSSCLARCLPSLLLLLMVIVLELPQGWYKKKLLWHCQILWYSIIQLIWKALRCINLLMVQFHLLCVNNCSVEITLQLLENYLNHISKCLAVWAAYCDTQHAVTDIEHVNIAHLCSSCTCGDRLQSLFTLAVLILAVR